MQRRALLKIGIASAAVLAVVGGTAALLQPGLSHGRLSGAGREVFSAVGQATLDTTLPSDPAERALAVSALLDRVDILIQALPPATQGELSQLLSLLASTVGRLSLAGLGTAWPDASVAQVQQALQGMRLSSIALRQQAYAALHDIAAGAYFSEPTTWAMLGYPAPQII